MSDKLLPSDARWWLELQAAQQRLDRQDQELAAMRGMLNRMALRLFALEGKLPGEPRYWSLERERLEGRR